MIGAFPQRVRAAAVAAWWCVLVAVLFLMLQWVVYLFMMQAKPGFVMWMWGPNLTWEFVQHVWFWMMAAFKVCVWLLALLALWLTLWARQLNRSATT